MGVLVMLLVVGCLGFAFIDDLKRQSKASGEYYLRIDRRARIQKCNAEKRARKIQEQASLKKKIQLRTLRAELMNWYINHPKYRDDYKLLIRKELEVTQAIKGLKRRTISDIKYDRLLKASQTGNFGNDVMDILNTT